MQPSALLLLLKGHWIIIRLFAFVTGWHPIPAQGQGGDAGTPGNVGLAIALILGNTPQRLARRESVGLTRERMQQQQDPHDAATESTLPCPVALLEQSYLHVFVVIHLGPLVEAWKL